MLLKKCVAQEDPQNLFNHSLDRGLHWKFFNIFFSLTLFISQTQLIARKGAVQRKYIPMVTIFISSDVDYEAFGRICHSQQIQLGKGHSRLA